MLDFLKHDADAITLLKKDHDKVKSLFDQFEKADNLRQKKKIVADAIMELKIHATIEEEIFILRCEKKEKVDQDLLNEADEEHHVAKLLIAELEQMDGTEDHYDAKFTVLSENIRHHVKEEENDLFPQARRTDVDFVTLGEKLTARKQQLIKNGVPPCAEEKMIAAHRKGSGDSPAQAAKKKPQKVVKLVKSAAPKSKSKNMKPVAKSKKALVAKRKPVAKSRAK